MYPDDSYIKPARIGSTTHNFLLCIMPAPKYSCSTEPICMTKLKKGSIHDVMFCTLLPVDLSYNDLFIESIPETPFTGSKPATTPERTIPNKLFSLPLILY